MRTDELDFHPRILIFGRQVGDSKPKGICAVFIDDIERIDSVAFRFRHRLPIAVKNFGVDVDFLKGNFIHIVKASHNHPRDPEGDDIPTRDECARGIKIFQLGSLLWPTEC